MAKLLILSTTQKKKTEIIESIDESNYLNLSSLANENSTDSSIELYSELEQIIAEKNILDLSIYKANMLSTMLQLMSDLPLSAK
ncbi:MAG: hypothetical protein Kow0049_05540 [Stanieria sp.]